MSRDDELAVALAEFFDRSSSRDGHRVEALARLSGGASRETFAFDLVGPEPDAAPRPLILQRIRAGALSPHTMEDEATLLRAADAAGVPVPPVVAASDETGVAGASFAVVERVEGEALARRIQRDDEFAEARRVLVAQCGAALAAVHRIPVEAVAHLRAAEPVGQLRSLLDGLGEPHPAFELALAWLGAHRPPERETVVVHGDFRLGNLLVDAHGLAAVLDWELAHLGDPVEDLGWLCVRAWRFGQEPEVAGLGSVDELLEAYRAAGGATVDRDELRWWQVLGTVRWGLICILQAQAHLSGVSRSVELATIGRRVAENEYDVLRLVDPTLVAPIPLPDPPDPGAGLYGRPTAGELVEAVSEFLRDDVMANTDGRLRFHARVAANALGMVERELRLGPEARERHRERLARLGCASDTELGAAIRIGDLDERADEVRAEVFASVVDKLLVANPAYL